MKLSTYFFLLVIPTLLVGISNPNQRRVGLAPGGGTTSGAGLEMAQKQITLEDIFLKNTFAVKRIQGLRSMKDGEHYTTLTTDKSGKEQVIVMYEYKTGNVVDTVLKSDWLKLAGAQWRPDHSIAIDDYQFSVDESKLLIASESEQIYRHSTVSYYYIWDRKSKKLTPLSKWRGSGGEAGKQMYAEFSPDENNIGFVRDNNLYIYNISSGKEKQITSDGKINQIINGATDWVYEEEFGFSKAWFWSPDGKQIAYYRFDESNVKEFSFPKYGTLYPTEYKFKYPKAGEENSKVSIHIYDLPAGAEMTACGEKEMKGWEYIPRLKWTGNPDWLSYIRMNRLQNKLELVAVNTNTKNLRTIEEKVLLTETSDTYIEISDNLTFLTGGNEFIWSSERDGFNHLYLYDMTGNAPQQITKGNWDVSELKGYDSKTKKIYYTSTEVSPMTKNLYSILLDGTNKKKLFPISGTDDAEFNSTYTYYIHTYTNANRPPVITLRYENGTEVRTLEDNTELLRATNDYKLVTKEFFKFKIKDGTELNGWMMKPSTGPKGSNTKFPVLMFVYGGPGINTVNDAWDRDYMWYQLLCQKGYVIVSVDNRGTGGRGKKFRDCTYRQLGKYETQDQIEAANYLATLPFIDKNRIGIWGWSYGGYMSSLCITKGTDVFKSAIAVAPVTNWRYYDNIYTERYMGLPQDNPDGYDENSPINYADNLKGKYLLIHGTADDNVHFQNSMEMADALIKANKQFEFFAYPDRNHSIYGGNTRFHLYKMLTEFLLKNL